MRKKMYWGIITLIIVILGATAVLILRDTDTEPEVIYKTDVEPARKTETPISEVTKQPPPGASPNGHWNGDEWHDGTHEPTQVSDAAGTYPPVETDGHLLNDPEALEKAKMLARRHPPFETYAHLLIDPEATLRKNAKIIVENYGMPEAEKAYAELNLLQLAIDKGYFGVKWDSEGVRLGRLKREVLWKPLEEMDSL